MPKVSALLQLGLRSLQRYSPTPRLDAELLLGFLLGLSKTEIITRGDRVVTDEQGRAFNTLLERRQAFEPIAYIIGFKEFWGLEFEVGPAVLVPRPETELLVEQGLAVLQSAPSGTRSILDLGTGSGCIACAIANELRRTQLGFRITASDNSDAALQIAARNVSRLGFGDVITTVLSDYFAGLLKFAPFDLVVSNPPYLAKGDPQIAPGLEFEPEAALYAGRNGFAAIEKILAEVGSVLKTGGYLLFEIGCTQAAAVQALLASLKPSRFSNPTILKDLAGLDRAVLLRRLDGSGL